MIGIVVPVHDEEECLDGCLRALRVAAAHPRLRGEGVEIVVALDACSDRSADIARRHRVTALALERRNVGAARAAGARAALDAGARWLGFTDADSTVAPDWIASQLALASDVVCGTVEVRDWGGYSGEVQQRYLAAYSDAPGHRHIHGANLGVASGAYVQAGGFPELCTGEDVALVRALEASGASIAWTDRPRVVTSARRRWRAPDGFGAYLAGLAGLSGPVAMASAAAGGMA
ncbi:glycosyltransferase [Paracidovorax avenae]|uniref:glycosyltransferase n=1 Tax=Paracidovorax avenae TaxID=80867 RepID=UPI000D20E473|nr:glycosyltransferase [Paracidovorax avenae]AVT01148.1 glycosyl transferase [Paracidovorax avenae]AVT08151.1 glycosyl transferase [Paracidovorax avenae]